MTRVEKVNADIEIESNAIYEIDFKLLSFLPTEVKEELEKKRRYHMNRLFFFSFALTAAVREDENDMLMVLGRQKEKEMEMESNG